jgi:hypothetical protein
VVTSGATVGNGRDGEEERAAIHTHDDSRYHVHGHHSDRVLIRFLRARKGNVEAAVKLWLECKAWRHEMDVSHWRRDAPGPSHSRNVLRAYEQHGFEAAGGVEKHPAVRLVGPLPRSQEYSYRRWVSNGSFGYDKEGHPIYWERTGIGAVYLPSLVKEISHDDIILGHIRQQELALARCEEASIKFGKYVGKQTIVLDMKGLSMWPRAGGFSIFKRLLVIDSKYYPESLNRLLIINAPWIFCSIWKMIKPLLDPVTASKAMVLGSNFLPSLLESIDQNQIPEEFGGTSPITLETARLRDGEAEAFVDGMYAHEAHATSSSSSSSSSTSAATATAATVATTATAPTAAATNTTATTNTSNPLLFERDGGQTDTSDESDVGDNGKDAIGGDAEEEEDGVEDEYGGVGQTIADDDEREKRRTKGRYRQKKKRKSKKKHASFFLRGGRKSKSPLDSTEKSTFKSPSAYKGKARQRSARYAGSRRDCSLDVQVTSPLLWRRSAMINGYEGIEFPRLLSNFKLRGKNYMNDRIKIVAKPSIFELIGCEYFRHDSKIFRPFEQRDHGTLLHRLRQLGDERYYFIISLISPAQPYVHCVIYYAVPAMYHPHYPAKARRRDETFHSLFRTFVTGSNVFRNSRFKVVPSVVEGHWTARNVTGQIPILLGRKLTQHYHASQNHFEMSADIGSSKVAAGILRVLSSYASTLTIDLLFVLQGQCKDELPERILGSIQIRRPDLSAAGSPLLSDVRSLSTEREQFLEAKRWYDGRARWRALDDVKHVQLGNDTTSTYGRALLQALKTVTERLLREKVNGCSVNAADAADVILEADRLAASASASRHHATDVMMSVELENDPYAANKADILAARKAAAAAAAAAKHEAQKARKLEHREVARSLFDRGELWEEQFARLRKDLGDTPPTAAAQTNCIHDPVDKEPEVNWKGAGYWVAVVVAVVGIVVAYGFVR